MSNFEKVGKFMKLFGQEVKIKADFPTFSKLLIFPPLYFFNLNIKIIYQRIINEV